MPFRKKRPDGTFRPYWYVELVVPGFGSTGCLSTRTERLSRARRMEDALRWLGEHEYFDLLEALRPRGRGQSGALTLPDVLRARKEGRLLDLRRSISDPLLSKAIQEAAAGITYNNHLVGLRHLKRLAPENARLSFVTEPAHVNGLVAAMLAEGYAPRTVQNGLWNGLSKLLQHHYGKSRAREILAEAQRPTADDRRDVHLSAADLAAVVSNLEWEVRLFVLVTAGLGIDLSPALRLRVRDIDLAEHAVYVRDTKTDARPRTLGLPPAVAYAFLRLTEGRRPSEKVFRLTGGQIAYRWRNARKAAGLTKEKGYPTDVRIKDLRHTFAVHYLKGGGNVAGLQQRMGHRRPGQSLDYARHEAHGAADMEAAARAMGLVLPERLKSELPDRTAAPETVHEIPAWWFDPDEGPRPLTRYAVRGTAGWSGDERKETNRRWMQTYRNKEAS